MARCIVILLSVLLLTLVHPTCYAGFPISAKSNAEPRAHISAMENQKLSSDDTNTDEDEDYYATGGIHGGHGHHSGGHSHFHGFAGHSHYHSSYHHSYHYHNYHHHYGSNGGGGDAVLGSISEVFTIATLCTFLIAGSAPAIVCASVGAVFGVIALFADHRKRHAVMGVLGCGIEAALLITLYALFII